MIINTEKNTTTDNLHKSSNTSGHSNFEKAAMALFIVSLGLGEVVSVGSLKLSYITAILYVVVMLCCRGGKIQITVFNKQYSKLLCFCYLWLAYAFFQIILVQDFDLYWMFFRILAINIVIIYFIITYIETIEDWFLIQNSFILLITISLLVGQWEIVTGSHIVTLTGEGNLNYYSHRPLSFYGNGNDYATVLMLGIMALVINVLVARKQKIKPFVFIAYALICAESIYQIVVIDCRGALYSVFLFGGLLIILCIANKLAGHMKNGKLIINVLLVMIAIGLVVLIFSNYSPSELITKYSGDANYGSDMSRLRMIENGVKSPAKSAGFGLGAGQSILINNINIHFFYLEILLDYGVFIGGYLIIQFFKLAFIRLPYLDGVSNATIQSYPIVLILLGVASSGMVRLRATWVVFALIYSLAYNRLKN